MSLAEVVAIVGIIAGLAVAASAFLVFLQVRRMRLSQEVTVALSLYDRSTSTEMLESALWVKKMPEGFSYDQYRKDDAARRKLEQLWYYFEFVGVLVLHGYVSEELVFDQQGSFISGMWDKCQNLIKARRKDRRTPTYMENFELLRKRYLGYASTHAPKLQPESVRKSQSYYEGENRSSGGGRASGS